MSTMRITDKATRCGLRAASPLSQNVFAKKFHNDTTEQELLDYLNANDITAAMCMSYPMNKSESNCLKYVVIKKLCKMFK